MRKIAIMDDFLSSEHKDQIGRTAARLGFFVDYFARAEDALPQIDQYEIFFGHDVLAVLQAGQNLRWFAAALPESSPTSPTGSGPIPTAFSPTVPGPTASPCPSMC